jgi:hypothetical protein
MRKTSTTRYKTTYIRRHIRRLSPGIRRYVRRLPPGIRQYVYKTTYKTSMRYIRDIPRKHLKIECSIYYLHIWYFPYHRTCDMESTTYLDFPYHKICDMESTTYLDFPYHKICDMESTTYLVFSISQILWYGKYYMIWLSISQNLLYGSCAVPHDTAMFAMLI